MKSKLAMFVLAVAACAATASASTVFYTFTMLGAGTLNGNNFTATTITFNLTSDTSLIGTAGAGIFVTPNDIPGTFNLAGFASGTITEAGLHVFDNQGGSVAGIGANTTDLLDISDASFGTYDLTTSFTSPTVTAPTNLDAAGYATDAGQLIITSARNVVFTAEIVPEPGTFAFLGGGLALIAAAYRRRTR